MPHSAGGWALRTVPLINTKKDVIREIQISLITSFSIQGSQSEWLRRVRAACKATSSLPHACA